MKWVAISGSWRKSNEVIRRDVRSAVARIMALGDGIVVGGALGVDFVATEEALLHNAAADRIKIIIPSSLELFAAHYRKRAVESVITHEQAESLIALLEDVRRRNHASLVEMHYDVLNEATYYDRNTKILEGADELYAFQVNGSLGVQDTIDKAHACHMPVSVKRYEVGEG